MANENKTLQLCNSRTYHNAGSIKKILPWAVDEGREGKDRNHFLAELNRQEKICGKTQDGCFRHWWSIETWHCHRVLGKWQQPTWAADGKLKRSHSSEILTKFKLWIGEWQTKKKTRKKNQLPFESASYQDFGSFQSKSSVNYENLGGLFVCDTLLFVTE